MQNPPSSLLPCPLSFFYKLHPAVCISSKTKKETAEIKDSVLFGRNPKITDYGQKGPNFWTNFWEGGGRVIQFGSLTDPKKLSEIRNNG